MDNKQHVSMIVRVADDNIFYRKTLKLTFFKHNLIICVIVFLFAPQIVSNTSYNK